MTNDPTDNVRAPIRVLDAEIPFINAAQILGDVLHRIHGRLMFGIGDSGEDTFVRFLIDRAKLAIRQLDHESITGIDKELNRIKQYINGVEKHLNERESI